jgi:uncharacterized membrane protein (DUF2068 family)
MENSFDARMHLSVLFWILATLAVLLGLFSLLMFAAAFAARADAAAGDSAAAFAFWMVLAGSVFFAGCALVDGVVAWGIRARKRWARTAGLVLSAIYLPTIPVGTIVGGYGLWVLTKTETERELRAIA